MSQSVEAAAPATATVAAIDLGSNSFHMVVARTCDGELKVIDRHKESVCLVAGLDANRQLSDEAQARALSCLQRFGERLRDIPPGRIRAVGTNALRCTRNIHPFINQAEAALGQRIDIISGTEEARLIYAGVTCELGAQRPRRLVIDIGGSSTEIVIGRHTTPKLLASVALGAVVHSQHYFLDGHIDQHSWESAVHAARLELQHLERDYPAAGWDSAIGASGSIKAVQKICVAQGWTTQMITRDALARLSATLVQAGHVDKLVLPGLSDSRRPILAGGTAVLSAVFTSLKIEQLAVSDKALCEGLLLGLLGHINAPAAGTNATLQQPLAR